MLDDRRRDLPRSGQTNTLGAWTMLLAVVEGLAVPGEREEAAKYREIGMPKHIEMAEAMLGDL